MGPLPPPILGSLGTVNVATAPRIAAFGSVNMDLVAYVAAAPGSGQTVTGTEFRQVPGGKGANQAIAAARAGGDVSFLGAVGDDALRFASQAAALSVERYGASLSMPERAEIDRARATD